MNKDNNLAKLFLIISIFFGTFIAIIVPPFNAPDEDSHFLYAYELSTGNYKPQVKNKETGYYVPQSIFDYIKKYKKITNERDKKYSYGEMYYDQLLSTSYNDIKFSSLVVETGPIIAYIVPALGIQITDYLKAYDNGQSVGVGVMLQFSRFLSLLIYSIIGYFAIKITPKFKKSFFVIMLLPVSLFLRSVVSYDGLLLSIVALVLANILNLICNENIKFTKKHFILFVVTGFILLNVKVIYSIVFFALLAIPESKFNNNKNKFKQLIFMAITILLLYYFRKLVYMGLPGNSDPYIAKQISFIKSNPIKFIGILFGNIFDQLQVQDYWLLGCIGNLDTYLPVLVVFIIKIFLIITIIIESFNEKIKLPKWLKLGFIVLIFLSIIGMYTMMYISWTPYITGKLYGNEITGIQGRYYLPLLLLLPIIFSNSFILKNKTIEKIFKKIELIYNDYFVYITIFILTITSIILFMRYYC